MDISPLRSQLDRIAEAIHSKIAHWSIIIKKVFFNVIPAKAGIHNVLFLNEYTIQKFWNKSRFY